MMAAELKPYPAYKDSGVPWLGEMPSHWEVCKLRSVLTKATERNRPDLPLLSVVREKGVILRDVTDMDENHNFIPDDLTNYKVVHEGQFAMNKMKAWQGSYGVSRQEGIVSPAYFIFDINGVTGDYFHVAVRSKAYIPFFTQASDGVRIGQWDLSQARMREIPFLVPPFPEQTAIVRFLDHADQRIQRYIHAKEKLIALLEEQKQAIIHQAATGQIDVRTGQPYPAYKPSGVEWLGEVPEHWERRRLKTLLRSVDRRSTTGKETLLSLRRDYGVVVYAEHFARPPQGRTLVGFKLVAEGQLVVNRMQANNGLVFCSGINGLVSPDYSVFEMREPLQMQYLSDLLRISGYRAHFRREATGLGTGTAGFLRLYDEKLLETAVFLPPLEEQILILKSLAEGMARIKRLIEREQRELQLIGEYRTRLIADVVTGKLDVREAAAALPEVDPLAAEDTVDDTLDTDAESTLDELAAVPKEAEA